MQINKFKLYGLILVLTILQITINASSKIYIDILGALMVVILAYRMFEFYQLIILAIIADFIGTWYLGTHVIALTLLSIITNKYSNFYKILNYLQKNIFIIIYGIIQYFIIYAIGIIVHHSSFSFLNFIIQIIFIYPLILFATNKLLINNNYETFI